MYNDVKASGRIRVSKGGNTEMSASYVRGLRAILAFPLPLKVTFRVAFPLFSMVAFALWVAVWV